MANFERFSRDFNFKLLLRWSSGIERNKLKYTRKCNKTWLSDILIETKFANFVGKWFPRKCKISQLGANLLPTLWTKYVVGRKMTKYDRPSLLDKGRVAKSCWKYVNYNKGMTFLRIRKCKAKVVILEMMQLNSEISYVWLGGSFVSSSLKILPSISLALWAEHKLWRSFSMPIYAITISQRSMHIWDQIIIVSGYFVFS